MLHLQVDIMNTLWHYHLAREFDESAQLFSAP